MPAVCKSNSMCSSNRDLDVVGRASSFVRRKIPRLPADRPIIPIDFINRDGNDNSTLAFVFSNTDSPSVISIPIYRERNLSMTLSRFLNLPTDVVVRYPSK
jgi:hypothetical protein